MFEKQIKAIEDQREKHIKALEDLKPKGQTKAIKGKPNNQSVAATIFNDLIKKRKKMNELYESADKNKIIFSECRSY